MSHLLIVGQKHSSITDYLTEHGHTYTLLRDAARATETSTKNSGQILTDFSSRSSAERALTSLQQKPDGVIAIYENYILPASWIAEALDLPGLPIATAQACTDKFMMRGLFAKAPTKISPAFALVENEQQLIEFAKSHDFPLILKPTNLAKSLLVTKNHDLDELIANYRKSIDLLHTIYKKFAPNREPQLIIEEFLEGSIHSVDAFVDSNGDPQILDQIVDYETGYDIGYDDNFHYSRILPSSLTKDQQRDLKACAETGIRALGMKNSPAHIEIIMTRSGPRIVEIGARNGGYRPRMHMLANGIDIVGSALQLSLGEKPTIHATRNDACAVLEIFPKLPGTFSELSNLEQLKQRASVEYVSLKAKPGQHVGKSSDGYKMCAVVILHNKDGDQFAQDLQFVRDNVAVITD